VGGGAGHRCGALVSDRARPHLTRHRRSRGPERSAGPGGRAREIRAEPRSSRDGSRGARRGRARPRRRRPLARRPGRDGQPRSGGCALRWARRVHASAVAHPSHPIRRAALPGSGSRRRRRDGLGDRSHGYARSIAPRGQFARARDAARRPPGRAWPGAGHRGDPWCRGLPPRNRSPRRALRRVAKRSEPTHRLARGGRHLRRWRARHDPATARDHRGAGRETRYPGPERSSLAEL